MSEAQALVCLPVRGAPSECHYNILLCCDYFSIFIVECGIARFLWVYLTEWKFRHHPRHLQPTFVSNFVFATSIAYLAHREKSRTHSPSLFDALGTEVLALRNKFSAMGYWSVLVFCRCCVVSLMSSFMSKPGHQVDNTWHVTLAARCLNTLFSRLRWWRLTVYKVNEQSSLMRSLSQFALLQHMLKYGR